MNFFIQSIFLFYILVLFPVDSLAQEKDNYTAGIDQLIHSTTPFKFNGVILITKKGKTVYSNAVGFKNINTKTPLSIDDRFEIMSNSKQFTSVLLLKEVDKGRVLLNAPIKTYLPSLSQSWADTVTVHQLLNHTHGIVEIDKPLEFKAGSDFKYGNISNILLGKIIANSSKKSYTDLAKELFEQLQLKNTSCYLKETNQGLVSGHLVAKNESELVDSSFINTDYIPAAGIVTTARDLTIWNENLHKGKILSEASYLSMTTESVLAQHNVFGKEKKGYGYNIRVVEEHGIKYLGHTGLGDGFSSLNIYIPKYDISIIVLENQMNDDKELNYYYETKIKDIILKSNLLK